MSGTNPVGAWALPFSTGGSVDDPTSYKGKIDADLAVAQRVADAFAPKPASPSAMSVVVDAGFTVGTGPSGIQSVVEIGAQTLTIAAAPGAPNNRIDLVVLDEASGTASVVTGTPAGSPVAPALTAGKKQIAQVSVPNGTTSIANGNITDLRAVWQTTVPGVRWAIAGGSADTITASYTPANATLADGLILGFRATAANATTTPSFNADGLGAKTMTKQGGAPLAPGDIPGALAIRLMREREREREEPKPRAVRECRIRRGKARRDRIGAAAGDRPAHTRHGDRTPRAIGGDLAIGDTGRAVRHRDLRDLLLAGSKYSDPAASAGRAARFVEHHEVDAIVGTPRRGRDRERLGTDLDHGLNAARPGADREASRRQ